MESLKEYMPWRLWAQQGHGGAALATVGAVEWFIRHHKEQLAREGHLIPRRGPGGHLVGPKFGEAVLRIMREGSGA